MRWSGTRAWDGLRLLEGRSQGRSARVLVADDDAAIRQFIAVHLIAAGFRVSLADGADAMVMAGLIRPDVLVLDTRGPESPGCDVAARLRADPATEAIRTVELYAGDVERSHAVVDASLAKPFSPQELVAIVQRLAEPGPTHPIRAARSRAGRGLGAMRKCLHLFFCLFGRRPGG